MLGETGGRSAAASGDRGGTQTRSSGPKSEGESYVWRWFLRCWRRLSWRVKSRPQLGCSHLNAVER